jgi:hypothetical protein
MMIIFECSSSEIHGEMAGVNMDIVMHRMIGSMHVNVMMFGSQLCIKKNKMNKNLIKEYIEVSVELHINKLQMALHKNIGRRALRKMFPGIKGRPGQATYENILEDFIEKLQKFRGTDELEQDLELAVRRYARTHAWPNVLRDIHDPERRPEMFFTKLNTRFAKGKLEYNE